MVRERRTWCAQNASPAGTSTGSVSSATIPDSAMRRARDSPLLRWPWSASTIARAWVSAATTKYAHSTNQNGLTMVDRRTNCTLLKTSASAGRCSSSTKLLLLTAGMLSAMNAVSNKRKRRVRSATKSPSRPNAST